MPNYKIVRVPLARLFFVGTCGPCWQSAKFGRILEKQLQELAYGRTNSSSFAASGLCHLHGVKKRHDGCLEVLTGLRPVSSDVQNKSIISDRSKCHFCKIFIVPVWYVLCTNGNVFFSFKVIWEECMPFSLFNACLRAKCVSTFILYVDAINATPFQTGYILQWL